MSLPIPLTVWLSVPIFGRDVTAQARDLTFGWSDPGGYTSCRVSLDRSLSLQPAEIAYYGTLTVYDARTGMTVWEGRLEDPGRSAGRDGQVWDLAAVGGKAHTEDRTVPLVYVDRDLGAWRQADKASPAAEAGQGADPGDASGVRQALVLRFPRGVGMSPTARTVMRYSRLMSTGQKLGRFDYDWDAGLGTPNVTIEGFTRADGNLATGEIATINPWSTAGGTNDGIVVTDFPAGRNTVELRSIYSAGAAPVPDDSWWSSIYNISVRAMLMSRTGADVTTGYTTWTVLAHEVVADLLGRLLTQYDGAGATIATTSYPIDQLAYPDGATPYKILSDLMELESGHTWRVWERNSAGRYRFEWTQIPSVVRYEADLVDGYDSQGSADGLYNQVSVRWRDTAGDVQSTVRTSSVPALTAAGLIRQGQTDLGSEVGSASAAAQAGDAWLAARQYPANAGRLRVARPLLDLISGRYVQPWEIRPGLIRVRGILPRVDALNAGARDGVSVFRIVRAEYRVSDGAATLDLDSHAPSTVQALADLARAPITQRR